jgi:hypothetical protein
MSSVILTGDTSGTLTVSAPLVAGTNTLTLAAATGTLSPLVSATAQASTSGTSIDFTGIPSWAKRITVMFNGVSTSGTSNIQIQIGDGSVSATGYNSAYSSAANGQIATTGFVVTYTNATAYLRTGHFVLTLQSGNTWIGSGLLLDYSNTVVTSSSAGSKALTSTLDRVRITTVNGTDTFDAGSINVMWEG